MTGSWGWAGSQVAVEDCENYDLSEPECDVVHGIQFHGGPAPELSGNMQKNPFSALGDIFRVTFTACPPARPHPKQQPHLTASKTLPKRNKRNSPSAHCSGRLAPQSLAMESHGKWLKIPCHESMNARTGEGAYMRRHSWRLEWRSATDRSSTHPGELEVQTYVANCPEDATTVPQNPKGACYVRLNKYVNDEKKVEGELDTEGRCAGSGLEGQPAAGVGTENCCCRFWGLNSEGSFRQPTLLDLKTPSRARLLQEAFSTEAGSGYSASESPTQVRHVNPTRRPDEPWSGATVAQS